VVPLSHATRAIPLCLVQNADSSAQAQSRTVRRHPAAPVALRRPEDSGMGF